MAAVEGGVAVIPINLQFLDEGKERDKYMYVDYGDLLLFTQAMTSRFLAALSFSLLSSCLRVFCHWEPMLHKQFQCQC